MQSTFDQKSKHPFLKSEGVESDLAAYEAILIIDGPSIKKTSVRYS
jgi:hypothetical protein